MRGISTDWLHCTRWGLPINFFPFQRKETDVWARDFWWWNWWQIWWWIFVSLLDLAVTYTFHRLRERKRKCYGSSSSSLAMAQRIRCVYDFSHVDRQTLYVCWLSVQRSDFECQIVTVRAEGIKCGKRKTNHYFEPNISSQRFFHWQKEENVLHKWLYKLLIVTWNETGCPLFFWVLATSFRR